MTIFRDIAHMLARAKRKAHPAVSTRQGNAEFEVEHLPRYAAAKDALRQCTRESSTETLEAARLALASVLADDECERIEDGIVRFLAYAHIAADDELMRLAGRVARRPRP